VPDQRGVTLFDALQAFFQEHQYCGDLDGGVEGNRSLDDVLVRRRAGARRGVRLDSPMVAARDPSEDAPNWSVARRQRYARCISPTPITFWRRAYVSS
jgi:hypothetical protein